MYSCEVSGVRRCTFFPKSEEKHHHGAARVLYTTRKMQKTRIVVWSLLVIMYNKYTVHRECGPDANLETTEVSHTPRLASHRSMFGVSVRGNDELTSAERRQCSAAVVVRSAYTVVGLCVRCLASVVALFYYCCYSVACVCRVVGMRCCPSFPHRCK